MKIIVFNLHTFLLFVYHQYSVPTILQVVTPISFLKKVILYRFGGEGLLSTLVHLICSFNMVTICPTCL